MKKVRKIFIIAILLSSTFQLLAPSRESMTISIPPPVEPFRILIDAIGKVETGCDTMAYNPVEKAVGFFQIRPIRLNDYNIRTGSHYKMKDLYDYNISEQIFLFYATKIGPYDFEKIAKNWNGSGRKTISYWNKVKRHLKT